MKFVPVFLLALSSLSTFVNAGEFLSPQPHETLYSAGPAKQGSFTFIVPEDALTPEGCNSSTLLAVFRRKFYLWDVNNVPVMVEMPPVNDTSSDASTAPESDLSYIEQVVASNGSEQQQNTDGTA
ncbi:hypothetical protein BDB00DRAFT_869159 [Zychaea mexicana]|uniref:uncharacterized protein n=1 Tax=Zychaea mexicana TaxID=64656 RepID=UPI0022FEEC70|nr:uncharacterized protein BDB00DRAFT_869159 [Zychaea mexicana]KAI9496574.1 hypothetical protein BDB00DRAFT_869159 [Zychaea mexicana]